MKKLLYTDDAISEIIDLLEVGGTIVYPTETCYGLGCAATNQTAVDKIFEIKQRQREKSLLIVFPDREMAKEYVVWSHGIEELANRYWPGPLTIVAEAKEPSMLADGVVAPDGSVAFRISSHPIVHEITASLSKPIVSTSANISAMSSPYDIVSVEEMFVDSTHQPDLLLDGGTLPEQSPSTIVRVDNGELHVIRQGIIHIHNI